MLEPIYAITATEQYLLMGMGAIAIPMFTYTANSAAAAIARKLGW